MEEDPTRNPLLQRGKPFIFALDVDIENALNELLSAQLEDFKVACSETAKKADIPAVQDSAKIVEKEKAPERVNPPEMILQSIQGTKKIEREPSKELILSLINQPKPIQFLLPPDIYNLDIKTILKLMGLLSPDIARRMSDALNNAWEYFNQHIVPKLPLIPNQTMVIRNILDPKVHELFSRELVKLLLQVMSDAVLKVPTIEQLYSHDPAEARTDLADTPEHLICVAPERAYLVLGKNPSARNNTICGGFTKLHTCFGVMIRHKLSGKTVFAHFSDETALDKVFAKIFNEFNHELETSKQFEVRLIGGIKGQDKSELLFKFILTHLLANASERKCSFNILSINCFDTLLPYRTFNEEQNGDITVGCLFDRSGKPVLFSIPALGGYVPYTNRGDLVFLTGPAKQKDIWFFAQRTLESTDNDLLKLFDDTKEGYNEEFKNSYEQRFRMRLIITLLAKLAEKNLVGDPRDPFIINLFDQHIDEWRKNYCRIFSIVESDASYTLLLIDYITWQKYKTSYNNLPMPFTESQIDQLFINVLLKDDCLKILLLENVYQNCTNFICPQLSFVKPEEVIKLLQDNIISRWHLLTELACYQNGKYKFIKREPGNLVALLLQYPHQMAAKIVEWQQAKLKTEIVESILNKIIGQMPQGVIDMEILGHIRQRLEQEGVRLLSFLHEMSVCNPSLDELITNLAHTIGSTSKWGQCFPVNVNAEVIEVLNKWLGAVRLRDPHPLLSLKEFAIMPPPSEGCRLS